MPPHDTVAAAQLSTVARCYAVGRRVPVRGQGFAVSAPYELTVDGVDFGQSLTDGNGALAASFLPGGLAAGQAQIADTVTVSDGTATASARVTITRLTGATFGAGHGSSPRRTVPFEVWDFAPRGRAVPVTLAYVAPGGRIRSTVALGTTRGQCGALVTAPRPLFPFTPSHGTWTLRFSAPNGRTAALGVTIS